MTRTVTAVAGNWSCSADVRELHGAADVVRLHSFELSRGDDVLRFASIVDVWPYVDRYELTEALTAAAVESFWSAQETRDRPEVLRGDWLRDQAKDRVLQ